MATNNRPVGVLRVETIGFSKLDEKIISEVIEVQPVRKEETIVEGDRDMSAESDTYKPVITVTKNEAVLTKPGYQLQKITVKETDGGLGNALDTKEARTEVINILNPNEDGRQICSVVPSGPLCQRKNLEPIQNNDEFNNIIPNEKVTKNNVQDYNGLRIQETENMNASEPITHELINPEEDNIHVQKPEIELKEKEAIYNKPISRLPKRIVPKVEEIPVKNETKDLKTTKNIRTETLQIVDTKYNTEGRSGVHSIVPGDLHVIRHGPSKNNKLGISKPPVTNEKAEDTQDNKEASKNIKVEIFDTPTVNSNVPISPHKIRVQHEFNFETEKMTPNKIKITDGLQEQPNDIKHNDTTIAVTGDVGSNALNFQEEIEDDNPVLSVEVSTPIILEEIVNLHQIPDQIDEIFEELYDELAATDERTEEPKPKSETPEDDKTIGTQMDDLVANLNEPSIEETPIGLKDNKSKKFTDPEGNKILESESIKTKEIIICEDNVDKTKICDSNTPVCRNSSEISKETEGIRLDISPKEIHEHDIEINKETLVMKEKCNQVSLQCILPLKDEPLTKECDSPTLTEDDKIEQKSINSTKHEDVSSESYKSIEGKQSDISPNEARKYVHHKELNKEVLAQKDEGHQQSLQYVLQSKDEPITKYSNSQTFVNDINQDFDDSSNSKKHENVTEHTNESTKETAVVLNDNIDQFGNVYTPVLIVTKTEIVRTTPTSKLQKITVTEKHPDAHAKQMLENHYFQKTDMVETTKNYEIKNDIDLKSQRSHEPELRNRNSSKDKMKEILDRSSDDYNQLDIPKRDYQITKQNIQKKTDSSNERSNKEFKPKIVHELTKQEVRDKDSKIPKKNIITDLKSLSKSDENPRDRAGIKVIEKPENDLEKFGLKGKVKNILKTIDKRPINKNKSEDDNMEPVSTDDKSLNVKAIDENEEIPTHEKVNQLNTPLSNLNNSNPINETNHKKGIKGTVQNIIKNIVSVNKPSREDKDKHDEVGSLPNVQMIYNEELENKSKSIDGSKKFSIKGKVQRVLKRFESKNKDETIENELNVNETRIEAEDTGDKPTNTKVKYIRKQFELNKQDHDDNVEVQTVLPSRPHEKNDPFFLDEKSQNERYFKPRYFKNEDELAMEASRGKVKHILRKIESINSTDDRKGGLMKGKSMEHIPKITLDIRREFARRKSVSETVAMFESNTLTPIDFDGRPRKESANIRVDPTATPATDDMSQRQGKETVDSNGNGSTDSELQRKLDVLARAKEEFGTTEGPNLKLPSGDDMPAIAFGTGLLSSEAVGIIKAAIDLGYRHIDTAPVYGTERQVGEAIRAKIDDGTVTRKELFVTTKLWSTFHRRDLVEGAFLKSLKDLGLQYVDLFIIHNPISMKEGGDLFPRRDGLLEASESCDYMDAWLAMEDLVRKGLVRNIGVSNFNSEQITRVLKEGTIVPAVNQVECHQYLNQTALGEFCSSYGIVLMGYGTLGSAGTPTQFLTAGRPVLEAPLVKSIAEKHGKNPAQVLIRYQLQRGRCVVVKSSTAPRLWGNLQAATFTLTEDEMRALSELDAGERHYKMEDFDVNNKNYPFNIAF